MEEVTLLCSGRISLLALGGCKGGVTSADERKWQPAGAGVGGGRGDARRGELTTGHLSVRIAGLGESVVWGGDTSFPDELLA